MDNSPLGDFAHIQIAATIFIVLSVGIIVAIFVRSRAREGVPVFKLTEKDRADLQEVRRELGIRRILARLLGGFAGLCIIGGVLSLFQRDASDSVDWKIAVVMIALSQFLILCAWLLVRKTK